MAAFKETDIVIAKFDYKATDSQELDIHKGEKLTLIDDTQHWWKVMNSFGLVGYVPSNYVKRSKQGLFSSLRNTLGRRKSRTDLPPPSTGTSTGGRPPGSLPNSTRNGTISSADGKPTEASVESLDYVAPSLPSSSSGQSPTKGSTTIGYQPVVGRFSGNGTTDPRSSFLPSSRQLPPAHPGLRDQSPQKQTGDGVPSEIKKGGSEWNTAIPIPGTSMLNLDAASAAQEAGSVDAHGSNFGGGSISSRQICVARFAYTACQPDELTIQRGDRVCVLEKSSDGWWHGVLIPPGGSAIALSSKQQTCGWFPSNYVTMESAPAKPTILEHTNTNQPNNLNSCSQALTSSPAQMPPATMGTKSSAPYNTSVAATASTRASLPPPPLPAPQESSAAPSLASYSAVPFAPEAFSLHSQPIQPPLPPASQPLQQQQQQPSQFQPTAFVDGIGDTSDRRFCCHETVLTLYPFTRNQVEELSFSADEVLEVLDKPADDPDWWRCRNAVGNVGLVPRNYIRVIKNPLPPVHPPVHYPQASVSMIPGTVPQQVAANVAGCHVGEEVRLAFAMASPNAVDFARKPWYWGIISRSECESILNNLGISGEFIIRDSESHPGDLTITMNAGAKNRNFKVHVKNGEFYIGQKVFSSVDALIDNYRRHPIYKSEQEKHFLTRPFQHPDCGSFLHNPPPPASSLQVPMLMQSR